MSRVKPSKVPGVTTWDQANEAIRLIGVLERENARDLADYDDQVSKLKDSLKDATGPRAAQIKALAKDLEEFAEGAREDFGKARSRQLTHGRLGWRTGQPTVKGVPSAKNKVQLAAFLQRLRDRGLVDCVRTEESVDKEILRTYDAPVLAELGVEVVQSEDFWVEADQTEAPEALSAAG